MQIHPAAVQVPLVGVKAVGVVVAVVMVVVVGCRRVAVVVVVVVVVAVVGYLPAQHVVVMVVGGSLRAMGLGVVWLPLSYPF